MGGEYHEVVSVGHVDAEHGVKVLVLGQGGGVVGRGAASVEHWAKVGAVGVPKAKAVEVRPPEVRALKVLHLVEARALKPLHLVDKYR